MSPVSTIARKKRIAVAVLAALTTLGVAGASAASLGGVTSNSLGADVGVVASCDTDGVTVAYTNVYDATAGAYKTTTVAVSGINTACNGKAISLTLKDATGAALGTGSGTVTTGAASITLSPTALASSVTGAAVVISG
jgi:hypothetical protein